MTEETTTTETPLTNQQIAENTVKELSANELTKELQRLLDELDYHKREINVVRQRANENNSKYLELHSDIQEFLKEHIKDKEVTVDDLVELAAELDIKITKTVKVTFNVACEYEFDVPLSYNETDFSEHDFDIRISSNISDDDVEEISESFEVEDFEVEEND